MAGANNRYLYNGKELEEELGQYDYSPVVYCFNGVHELASSVMGRGFMDGCWKVECGGSFGGEDEEV